MYLGDVDTMQLRNRLAQDVRDGARLEEIRVMSISSTQDIRLIPAYGRR